MLLRSAARSGCAARAAAHAAHRASAGCTPPPLHAAAAASRVAVSRAASIVVLRRARATCRVPRAAMATSASVAASSATAAAPPQPILRKDYAPPPYTITTVHLDFNLGEEETVVRSTLHLTRTAAAGGEGVASPALELAGSPELVLRSLALNGVPLPAAAYSRTPKGGLLLHAPLPDAAPFTLQVEAVTRPQDNTSLEGLYKSSGNFCTQCEAEGFRRITFYLDRPDVMARFTTRIEASKAAYPVLLSNGNLASSGDAGGGRHYAVWEDPFPKPCYLFALVAGDLAVTEDTFVTASGRPVALRIFTQAHNADKTAWAMQSLKASLKWDEERYGLEYDLDLFNIVAVDDFNMGAMENKSLNIFNSRLVLATPTTATDGDYAAIESVVAHEQFHNWTGNRVTCRDWFQLTLKEGLTVYRDQEFSADMNSAGVQRIGNVARLRGGQFPQDAGPMAHPVRPDSYLEINNFYSTTVYEKGAEVVRLYETLLGRDGFRKGMDLYFKRHDGQAVTCDDFLAAMADANGADLSGIAKWYGQAGTPELTVATAYDAGAQTFTLRCSQRTPPTPNQPDKAPLLLPLAVGLLGPDGKDMALTLAPGTPGALDGARTTAVLRMEAAEATFVFTGVAAQPVPSILRGFSAPVKLTTDLSEADLVFLAAHDSDAFNRFEAGQALARALMMRLLAAPGAPVIDVPPALLSVFAAVLDAAAAPGADKALLARCLSLPGEGELSELQAPCADPDAIHAVRRGVVRALAAALRPRLTAALAANSAARYAADGPARAARSLKNTALAYLLTLQEPSLADEALARFRGADNMTDQIAALAALCTFDSPQRTAALAEFEAQWAHDPLVMNKWLGLQAASDLPGNVARVRALMSHPAFDIKNPNKVYALIGGFCSCAVNFHATDGSGYALLADVVLQLDGMNPQVAARMVGGFSRWKKFDAARQALMRAQLDRIVATPGLSENVFEIASKSLAG